MQSNNRIWLNRPSVRAGAVLVVIMMAVAAITGATLVDASGADKLIQEGPVWAMMWTDGKGETRGLTRSEHAIAVPGDSRATGKDLHARLYLTHIEVEDRLERDLGPMIIMADKLDFVQFGEGGVVYR